MFNLEVKKHDRKTGYPQPAHSFKCPLCEYKIYPDLLEGYVERMAKNHFIATHKVMTVVDITYVEA